MSIDISLQVFEGPLDLLMHLIEKNKVDIYDIPIVTITEQYLEYLEQMPENDLDTMSEFLVMAATLINIKARMLLPKEEKEEEDAEDPRDELVRRLLEYKMYKYAAYELRDMELDASRFLYKKPNIPDEVATYEEKIDVSELVGGMTLNQLNDIFRVIMRRQVEKIDPIRSKFGVIEKDEISVEDRMQEIFEEIKGLKGISFFTLLKGHASRIHIIVTFMAVLELMKIGAITIRQENLLDDIIIDSLARELGEHEQGEVRI